MTSFWSHKWSPLVMTSTPAEKISSAVLGVMPEPPAEFSPLAMTKSSACCSRSLGQEFLDRVASGLAHDVADEEQFHKPNLTVKQTKHTKEKKRWKTNQTKALKYPVGRRKGDVLMRRAFKLAKPLHDVRRLVGVGIGVGQVELVIFYGVIGFVFAPGNFAETVIDPV